jgi:hypothetical protein
LVRRACDEARGEKYKQLNDFSVLHVRSKTFNAQRSRFNPSPGVLCSPSGAKGGSPLQIQEAESKAPELQRTPKRRRKSDVEMAVTFWNAPLSRRFSRVRKSRRGCRI